MLNKLFITCIALVTLSTVTFSQTPVVLWSKCFGGTANEWAYAIKQTSDDGFLVLATTTSVDGDVAGSDSIMGDYWIIRLDSMGNLLWSKCYGGSSEERSYSLTVDPDDGFLMAGYSGSTDGDLAGTGNMGGDFWLVKCDSQGTIEWQQCYGGSGWEECYNVAKTFDGGYIATGFALSTDFDVIGFHDSTICPQCQDAWVIKLDSAGAIQWSRCYGGYWIDIGFTIIQTADSGFILASTTSSDDGDVSGNHGPPIPGYTTDFWIVKLDQAGNILWQKCRGGGSDEGLFGTHSIRMISTYDKGCIAIGRTTSADGDVTGLHGMSDDAWVFKMDSMGNIQWQKCLGGFSFDDIGSVIQLPDSSYLALALAGSSDGDVTGNHGGTDAWLVKLDAAGNIVWSQCYGGTSGDAAYDFLLTSGGEVVFAGTSWSNDGDVSGNHGSTDVWLAKLSSIYTSASPVHDALKDFTAYLNPTSNSLFVNLYANGNEKTQVQLLDITGREILHQPLAVTAGFNKQEVYTGELSSGVYVVRLQSGGGSVSKKLMVQ